MEKVKTLEDAKQLLAEYNVLPDNLDARLNWTGYDRLPDYVFRCSCGHVTTFPIGIDDLIQTLEKGWEWKLEHNRTCSGHDDEGSEEEEDEDDES